ncbi:hypothetical protein HK405_002707, partial [Cladochytrium tenue]
VPAVAAAIEHLRSCPEHELPLAATRLADWPLPKSDFFHWIPVLDRFDSILEAAVAVAGLAAPQTADVGPELRDRLLAVLRISKLLFENCTNRNLYGSFEHVINLLHCSDPDVVLAALQFLFRPSQRISRPKSTKLSLEAAESRILALASATKTGSP